jgi:asparagine synthase (glutamine-hydrolysing)
MCGIAGYVNRDPARPADRALLARMAESLRHRGPDEDGYLQEGPVGLAMRRLQVVDLKGGSQPLYNEDRTVAVVFNGEIYNFRELRRQLEARGHTFRTRSDTEVIVHQYEEDGPDCLERFNGMFALALWDAGRRRLLLARDRLGIKPLHWTEGAGSLAFGSEIKALLEHPEVAAEVDPVGLSRYLTHEYLPAPHTILRGVHKLPPGHRLLLQDGRVQVERWWHVRPDTGQAPAGEEEALEEMESRLDAAVERRLVSDVPLGAFLSGGVDSSMVVASMQRHTSRTVKTFSIGFEESSYDESAHARAVAAHLGTEHHERIVRGSEMPDLLPRVMDFLDEPLGDASILPTFLLSQFTREGVTVALSGDGGDELFGGYPTYGAHGAASWYRRLPAPLRRGLLEPLVRALPISDDYLSLDFAASRFIAGAHLPPLERHVTWMGSLVADDKQRLLTPELRDALQGDDELASARKAWEDAGGGDDLQRILHLDRHTYLQDDILTKVDRASMAHSLEVRVPLLDHHVVELAATWPSAWKVRGRQGKVLFKRLAARRLPRRIVERPKRGFAIPMAAWLRGPLQELAGDLLSAERLRRQGWFDPAAVQQMLGEHRDRRVNRRKPLFTLLAFQLWHQRWMERR